MEKRFQVFVSSTFKDLEAERQEVMHALLELDCIPAGMELFPAANETQWSLIKRVIDECDYYVLILAGRYGSLGPDRISYTEMEYQYAISISKPVVAFVHRNPGKIAAENSEETDEGRRKLADFRTLVEKKLCKQWETSQELGSVVSRSLIQLIKSCPAIGWVRTNELPDRDATLELLQLRRRVDELQAELEKVRTSAPKGTEELSQGFEGHKLRFTFEAIDLLTDTGTTRSDSFVPTWNEMFSVLAPLMIREASSCELKLALESMIEDRNKTRLRSTKRFERYEIRSYSIHNEDFQTVKIQFRALGLITRSEKARSARDSETYWTLTPYGDEVMTQLIAVRRNSDQIPDDQGQGS